MECRIETNLKCLDDLGSEWDCCRENFPRKKILELTLLCYLRWLLRVTICGGCRVVAPFELRPADVAFNPRNFRVIVIELCRNSKWRNNKTGGTVYGF